ncbi:hypothetical protein LNO78_07890 [Klebsiella pneumoniae subsp. pneumoniae]|nr:hypothetical protein [Klebsiella pneumoniae subsp. pneumoniae]
MVDIYKKGCVGWSLTAPLVDHCVIIALLMGYMDANRKERQDTSDISALIEAKNTSVGELNVSITNLVAVIEAGVNVSELASRLKVLSTGNDSNLLIVFYVQIMPDDFVMQLHRF